MLPPSTDWAGAREAGSRGSNEDFFAFTNPRDPSLATHGVLILVCDGVGGERGGEVAAETAVSVFAREFHASDPRISVEVRLRQCSVAADKHVKRLAGENATLSRMATTVVAAVVLHNEVHVVNAGDSRAYIVRANGAVLEQVSADHSWLQVQRDLGVEISEARARTHEKRSTITRSLGGAPNSEVDYRSAILLHGDRVLLCSDGISGVLSAESILSILRDHSNPSQAVQALFDGAGRSRAPDNMSAVILNYGAPSTESNSALAEQPSGRAKTAARWTLGALLGAGALMAVLAFVNVQLPGDRSGPLDNAGTSVPVRLGQDALGTPPVDRRTRSVDVGESAFVTTGQIAATPTVAPTPTVPPPTSTPIPTATATPRPPTPVPPTATPVPPTPTSIPPTAVPPTATPLPPPTATPTQAPPPPPPTVNQPPTPTPNTRR